MDNRTIAAISTPQGSGGIGIIRLSGKDSVKIAEQMFKSYSGEKVSSLKGYTGMLGNIFNDDNVIDEAIIYRYAAPKSYTGEEVVEISCHGGPWVTSQVLRRTFELGAMPAEAGEFTKRAFINGKMDLFQAEGVMDIISAQSTASLKAANQLREGSLSTGIKDIVDKILGEASHLAAWADYPEEEMEMVDEGKLLGSLENIIREIEGIINTFDYGQIIKEGITTTIVGKPNVGKSSLMNLLVGQETSIVTDVPGTTRDVVKESIRLGNLVLQLSDTAGIRETMDVVEQVGVERAKKQIDNAQLVLVIFDSSQPLEENDFTLIDMLKDKPAIALVNKSDLPTKVELDQLKMRFKFLLEISAKDNKSIGMLEATIEKALDLERYNQGDAVIIFNERQRKSLIDSKNSLSQGVTALETGVTLDAVGVCLDEALDHLLSLSGERAQEEVINQVFARFCVGK